MSYTKIKDFKGELIKSYDKLIDVCKEVEGGKYDDKTARICELLKKVNPSLMFYGVYNAGKSSLLNAVFGEMKASVADIPETHKVTYYKWKNFDLVDTPGINGPEKDFKISKAELEKHNIIMFVIDDSDSFDSMFVANEIVEIINQKKPLIIVLNNKQHSEEVVINDIRNKLYQNIKKASCKYSIACVEDKYEFISIDANMAFKGKTENKNLLIERSRINDLEIMISNNLKQIDEIKMLREPIDLIEKLLKEISLYINEKIDSASENNSSKMLNDLFDAKRESINELEMRVRMQVRKYNNMMYSAAISGMDINQLQYELADKINKDLEWGFKTLIQRFNLNIQTNIENVRVNFGVNSYNPNSNVNGEYNKRNRDNSTSGSTFDYEPKPFDNDLSFSMAPLPQIPPSLIFKLVEGVIGLFNSSNKRAQELDRLRDEIDRKNEAQIEAMNNRVRYIQEVRNQINIGLSKFEDEVLAQVREKVDEIYNVQQAQIEEVLRIQDEDAKRLLGVNSKIDDISKEVIRLKNEIDF